MSVPGVMLHVFGEDVRVAVNDAFAHLDEMEQRRILTLCRGTLDLAFGKPDTCTGQTIWISEPATTARRMVL